MNGTPSTALATRSGTVSPQQQAALAIKPGQLTWDKFQEAALSQIGLKNAGNADRAVFLHQCQRTGLDPFARQIYMIERREKQDGQWVSKWTIQTGIDGYRVNRARAERDAGVRGTLGRPVFYDWDGGEHKAWVRPEPPAACEITYTVRDANGGETPYTSVLRFDEYVQTRKETADGAEQRVPSGQWATKPAHMLEKCTEADVYRKAFPQDFSGIHLDDAMPLPDPDAPPPAPERSRPTADDFRSRRQPPQQVQSEVVHVQADADVPPPPEPPSSDQPQAPAPLDLANAANYRDPRNGVIAQFDRLRVTAVGERLDYAARLLKCEPLGGLPALTGPEAERLTEILARCGSPEQLREMLADGTAPGE